MLRSFLNIMALVVISASGPAALAEPLAPEGKARGNAEAASANAAVCAACHGAEGQGILSQYPNIGGQHYEYLLRQLRHLKSGERSAVLMAGQLDALNDDELKDLAAYYAGQPQVTQTAPADVDLAHGERIWRAGIAGRGIPACIACHGPAGAGNDPAGFPVLAGQNADYTAQQLRNYRAGERNMDEVYSEMMIDIASVMNDKDIEAVAAFAQGLE